MEYLPLLADLPVFIGVVGLGLPWVRPSRPRWIIPALAYIMLDGVLTIATPNPLHWHWNWLGELASIVLAGVFITLCRLRRNECGLVYPRPGTMRRASLYGIVAIIASVAANYLTRNHHAPGWETLAYEATMPGLNEELVFRGVLIGLFLRAYDSQGIAFLIAGAASTMAFGLAHGLTFDGSCHFIWLPFIFSALLGGLFVCMRWATGSIFPSIIAHNASNACGDFANGVG